MLADQRRPGDDQADRVWRSPSAASRRAGSTPSPPRAAHRPAASPCRLRPGRASPPPQSSTRLGHSVTVYERDEAPGGLLRFGVPDAKLEKWMIDRRVAAARGRGRSSSSATSTSGATSPSTSCAPSTTRVVIAIGSRVPRDLEVPGRELDGVHFAMDYLYQRNRYVARDAGPLGRDAEPDRVISAAGKHVVVDRRRRHRHGLRLERAARGRRRRADARRLPELPPTRPLPGHAVAAAAASAR